MVFPCALLRNEICENVNLNPSANLTMSCSVEFKVHNYAKYLTAPRFEPLYVSIYSTDLESIYILLLSEFSA